MKLEEYEQEAEQKIGVVEAWISAHPAITLAAIVGLVVLGFWAIL